MKPLSRAVAEEALRTAERTELLDALKRLPADVDAQLASEVVLRLLGPSSKDRWIFARTCQRLPAPVIATVLEALEALEREAVADPTRLFLREALRLRGELGLEEAWASALKAVLELDSSYAWGSKQKKAQFLGLARTPRFLAAAQAAVVGSPVPPAPFLAVLAAHGGEEAADALLTVFSRGGHDLRLELIETHAAKTEAMRALSASVAERLAATSAAGPFAVFAQRAWGFDPGRVDFHVWFGSVASPSSAPQHAGARFQCGLLFSSNADEWWRFSIYDVTARPHGSGTMIFGAKVARPGLGLEPCAVDELPTWLKQTSERLGAGGWREPTLMGGLRGKKRDVVLRWLFGA